MPDVTPTALDIEGLLQNSSDPIFAVNARQRLVFLNRTCAEWLGVAPAELLGLECRAHGPLEPLGAATLAAQLRPPPEARAGAPLRSHVFLTDKESKRSWRTIQWLPIAGPDGDVGLVVGRIGPAEEDAALTRPSEPLSQALARLRQRHLERFGFDQAIAACPAMLRALEQVRLASQSATCVLLRGEPGTGKEHLARVIHAQSAARQRPMIALDCTLTTDALGRLFTEALRNAGTLYLREPASLPRDYQQLVLDRINISGLRVIAGATADPGEAVAGGTLLSALHYALTTLVIMLPPLRERDTDLPLLAQQVIERCNAECEHQITSMSPALLELLYAYPWPGNLDEFKDVLSQAHARCRKAELDIVDLPMALRAAADRALVPEAAPERPLPLDQLLVEAERRLIQLAVRQARGNLTKAAVRLAVSRPRLYRRMQQLGLAQAEETPPAAETGGGSP